MSCSKVRYETLQQASAALRCIRRDPEWDKREKRPIRAYYCRRCSGFHLTSQTIAGDPKAAVPAARDAMRRLSGSSDERTT